MVSTIVHQLTRGLSPEEIQKAGFAPYYVDHTVGIYQAAGGVPFNACEFQSKGDPVTDLHEDLAAEQKASSTYDNILRLVKERTWQIRSVSFALVRLCISSVSAKRSERFRISLIPRIFMLSIQVLTLR